MIFDKKELRRFMKSAQGSLTKEDAGRFSREIAQRVEAMPEFIAARTILIYMSMEGEVQTAELIGRWCGLKRFVLPLVCGEKLELREYDPSHLKSGYRGILEPDEGAAQVDPTAVDLALIPGVAFAREEGRVWRLGRGGGFYDRLIPQLRCPTVGLAYSFRIVDAVPHDALDCPVDKIITDTHQVFEKKH